MFTVEYRFDAGNDPAFDRRRFNALTAKRFVELGQRWEAIVKDNLSGAVLAMRSGKLRKSIGHRAGAKSVTVYSAGVPYAGIDELGGRTRPHEIVATKAQALHFVFGAKDFAKSVHHPGSRIPARPFVRSALPIALAQMEGGADSTVDIFHPSHELSTRVTVSE
jgi:phage gpG-like protein